MSDHHLPENWIQKLQVELSIPGWMQGDFNAEVTRFFEAQARAEGGDAEWNPLNTTNHVSDTFGAWQGTNFNRITVANFTSPFHGIAATAATFLESETFAGWLADMRSAKFTAEELVNRNRAAIKEWGTNPDLMLALLNEIS